MLNNIKTQHGFSLIEIMIAMLLGIFVLGGLMTVYMSNKATYSMRNESALMDENGRVALRILSRHIEHAGYSSRSGADVANYIIPAGTTLTQETCSDGQTINIKKTSTIQSSQDGTKKKSSDSIGIAFEADELLRMDCNGIALPDTCDVDKAPSAKAAYVYSSFLVGENSEKDSTGAAIPILYCAGSRHSNKQPLAQGIENIQFLYGVATKGSSVDRYMSATDINNASGGDVLWNKILSVRVGVLVRSLEPIFTEKKKMTYHVLDQQIKTEDRYKRNVYTTTVRLRNINIADEG